MYMVILQGQGDTIYSIISEEQWKLNTDKHSFNDYCLQLTSHPDDIAAGSIPSYLTTFNASQAFAYIRRNNIEIKDVFTGMIY